MPKILHEQKWEDGQSMHNNIFRVVELDNKDLRIEESYKKDSMGNSIWYVVPCSNLSQYAEKLAKLYRELLDRPKDLQTMLGPPPKPINMKKFKLKPYPLWVCKDCGLKASKGRSYTGSSTFHGNICQVCNEIKAVTEARDFGYPKFEGYDEP